MKVPVLESPQVVSRPIGTPFQETEFDTAPGQLTKLARAGGQAVGALIDEQRAAGERATADAEATARAIAKSNLQRRITTRNIGDSGHPDAPPGLFQLRGMDAVRASGDVLEKIDDDREEIARTLPSPREQERFRIDTLSLLDENRNRTEMFTAGQIESAKQSAKRGLMDETLRAVQSNPSPEAVRALFISVEQSVRELQKSQQEGTAEISEWREKAAMQAMDALLAAVSSASGAVDVMTQLAAAKEALEDYRPLMDAKASAHYAEKIAKHEGDATLLGAAREIAAKSRDVDGWMRETYALPRAVEWARRNGLSAAQDEELQGKVRLEVQKNKTARKEWADTVDDKVTALVNVRGWWGTPTGDKELLNKANPDKYRSLMDAAEARTRARAGSDADMRRWQAEENRRAFLDFRTMPPEERAGLNVTTWLGSYGTSPVGKSAILADQTAVVTQLQKGEGMAESVFRAEAMAVATPLVRNKKDIALFKAETTRAYQDAYRDKKRPPNHEESSRMIAELLANASIPGRIWGTREVPGFQAHFKKRERALELQREGKSISEISAIMTDEGW